MEHKSQTFVERLKELVEEFSGGRYSRFAKLVGTGATTIDNYLRDKSLPGMDMITTICERCGVTPNWLILGWEPKYGGERRTQPEAVRVVDVANAGAIKDTDLQTVPILGANAWREDGIVTLGPDSMEGFLVAPALPRARLAAFRMVDAGMGAEIDIGSYVIFDMENKKPMSAEDTLVVARLESGVTVRRLVGDQLIPNDLRSFKTARLSRRDLIGRVIEVRRRL